MKWLYGACSLVAASVVVMAVLASAGALASPAVGAATPAYQMVDLGVLPGGTSSEALSINDRGEVVGTSYVNGSSHVFYWSQATGIIDTGVVRSDMASWQLWISDRGEIAGTLVTSTGANHAFVWSRAHGLTDLGTLPGGTESRAAGIDATGRLAGTSGGSGSQGYVEHAFVWSSTGGMVALDVSGATSSYVTGISHAGQVIGNYVLAGNVTRAFSWTPAGGIVSLGTLGGHASYATAVGENGEVVGESTPPSEQWDMFSWTFAGGMQDLGPLVIGPAFVGENGEIVGASAGGHVSVWTQADGYLDVGRGFAMAVSDGGQIVGSGYLAGSVGHAWTWTRTTGQVDLGTLDRMSWAYGVNDYGEIVGASETANSRSEAVLWLPPDTTPPTLTLPGNVTVDATSPAGAIVTYTVTADDPDDAVSSLTCLPVSGSTLPIGDTAVHCSATDSHGNVGNGTFVVHVRGAGEQIQALRLRLGVMQLDPLFAAQLDFALRQAQTALAHGQNQLAIAQLQLFKVGLTRFQLSRWNPIGPTNTAELIATANRIIAVIG